MKRLILILSLIIISLSLFSQGSFFGSYSKKTPIVEGDLGLYCGGSYARIYLGEAYGAHIKRYGILYCDNDCGGYLPIDNGFTQQVEWVNPISVNFSSQVSVPLPTKLVQNVRYWYQAFIETNDGIFYGPNGSQEVSPICSGTPPTVVACTGVSNITLTSALACGQVTYEGSSSVTSYGICYSTSQNPTIASSSVAGSGAISGFTASLTGLNRSTTYYYKAYAQNDAGISYSNEYSFTTLSQLQPTLITNAITSITTTTAISGGHILTDGNAPIIEKGICYKIGSTPISTDNTINNGSGSGDFTSDMTGLSPNTEYHVRAWARNSFTDNSFTYYVLGYGQEEIFTTSSSSNIIATLSSAYVSEYSNSIGVNWIVTLDSAAPTNVSIPISITDGTNTGNVNISIAILAGQSTGSYSTNYYKQANAWTAYANFGTMPSGYSGTNTASYVIPASTPSCTVPVLATNSITSITTNSATSGGVISSDGGCSITSKGVQWSLTSDFSTIVGSTSNGTGTGSFTSSIAGLNCGTTYYVRSYATNTAGTGYGSTVSFITNSSATVSIASFSAVTSTSFTANCSVASSCSNITSRGIIYSTSSGVTYPTNAQVCGSGTGTFDCSPYATLTPNTTYYVKAYAIINGGSIYLSTESTVTTLPTSISVGDTYNGGVVAYIFQSGDPGYVSGQTHGIIAATSDQSSGIQWYNGSYVVTDATSEGVLGGGLSNTNKIVSVQGSGSYAAKLCYDLTLNGYSDWVLPNMGELRILYTNKSLIGGFSSANYWSSYEGTSMYAGLKSFYNGDEQTGNKSANWIYVRAIRYF